MHCSIFLALALQLAVACKEQSFTGNSGNPSPKPAVKKDDATQTPPPPECTEARLLSIRNLTAFVDQKQADRSVTIELTFEPCKNQTTWLNLPFLFDLDALLKFSGSQSIPYRVKYSGQDSTSSGQGEMNYIIGSDLFGKTGATWGHFESLQSLQANPLIATATLELLLSPVVFTGRPNSPGPITSNFSVPMNVKVGTSAPILVNIQISPP